MKPSHTIRPVFDDPNLVSAAGLVPALRLGWFFKGCAWIGWQVGTGCGFVKAAAYFRVGNWKRGAAEVLGIIADYGVGQALKPLAKRVKAGFVTDHSKLWERVANYVASFSKHIHQVSFGEVWGGIVGKILPG